MYLLLVFRFEVWTFFNDYSELDFISVVFVIPEYKVLAVVDCF